MFTHPLFYMTIDTKRLHGSIRSLPHIAATPGDCVFPSSTSLHILEKIYKMQLPRA